MLTDKQLPAVPVQVVGGLVQECVILSDKLSPDQLGTWLLHHHFFGQLEISAERKSRLRSATGQKISLQTKKAPLIPTAVNKFIMDVLVPQTRRHEDCTD